MEEDIEKRVGEIRYFLRFSFPTKPTKKRGALHKSEMKLQNKIEYNYPAMAVHAVF